MFQDLDTMRKTLSKVTQETIKGQLQNKLLYPQNLMITKCLLVPLKGRINGEMPQMLHLVSPQMLPIQVQESTTLEKRRKMILRQRFLVKRLLSILLISQLEGTAINLFRKATYQDQALTLILIILNSLLFQNPC